MKLHKFIFTLLTLFVFIFQSLSQNAPCYKRKKIYFKAYRKTLHVIKEKKYVIISI